VAGSTEIREILVPLDGSGTAEWAVPTAVTIARRSGARLHLMLVHAPLAHLFPDVTAAGYLDDWEDRQKEEETRYVRGVASRLKEAGLRAVAETCTGDAADRLADRAARLDMVVMTPHGWAGPDRAWLGHVADAVVHHVRRPVLIARAEDTAAPEELTAVNGFRSVLVATDGSPAARAAEWHGEHMARLFGARLTLFRAVRAPTGPSSPYIPHAATLDREAVAQWEAEAREYVETRAGAIEGLDVDTRVDTTYHAARAILEAAAETGADMLAVGTHRDSRLARAVLGSVADKVVRGAGVPVLIAHADAS
jgi:nucleotide-binding universal stress UspA family protein